MLSPILQSNTALTCRVCFPSLVLIRSCRVKQKLGIVALPRTVFVVVVCGGGGGVVVGACVGISVGFGFTISPTPVT